MSVKPLNYDIKRRKGKSDKQLEVLEARGTSAASLLDLDVLEPEHTFDRRTSLVAD